MNRTTVLGTSSKCTMIPPIEEKDRCHMEPCNQQSTKDLLVMGIESLYPIDAPYEDTSKIGEILLMSAFRVAGFNWRDLPENVLSVYLSLCKKEDETGFLSKELKEYGSL